MIDVHVHFRDANQREKETIEHGYAQAHKAGIFSTFDMPNTAPPLTTKEAVVARLNFGQGAVEKIDSNAIYRIYVGITSSTPQIEAMLELYNAFFPRIVGFKMFAAHSTGNMGLIEKEEQRKVYHILSHHSYKGVIAVHCEKTSYIKEELFDLSKPYTHSLARPPISELESIKDQIELAKETGFEGALHICHISTKDGLEEVKKARAKGMRISAGATAHHALLDVSSYERLGLLVKMNPPLRCAEDKDAIFTSLLKGDIDWIESDHAPHTLEDKKTGASGIPGFAGTLLLIKKLRQANIKEEVLRALCGGNVNKVFSLNLPITIPSNEKINAILPSLRRAYPFDAFKYIT